MVAVAKMGIILRYVISLNVIQYGLEIHQEGKTLYPLTCKHCSFNCNRRLSVVSNKEVGGAPYVSR